MQGSAHMWRGGGAERANPIIKKLKTGRSAAGARAQYGGPIRRQTKEAVGEHGILKAGDSKWIYADRANPFGQGAFDSHAP